MKNAMLSNSVYILFKEAELNEASTISNVIKQAFVPTISYTWDILTNERVLSGEFLYSHREISLYNNNGLILFIPYSYFENLLQKSKKDALNFDAEFTKEEPVLTPVNMEVLRSINQEEFKGFSFINRDFNPARFVADKAAT